MAHVDVYILSPIFGIAIYANCLILLNVRLLLCYKLRNKWSVVCFKFTFRFRFHRYLCSYISFLSSKMLSKTYLPTKRITVDESFSFLLFKSQILIYEK